MTIGAAISILKQTFNDWSEDNASTLAQALAYAAVFSIAPMLLIAVAAASLIFGDKAAQGQIYGSLQGVVGADAAKTLQGAVAASQKSSGSIISLVIGIATLVWSASSLFSQLQNSLNIIWNVQAAPGLGIIGTIKKRALTVLMVFGIAVLLLASLLISTALAAVSNFFGDALPGSALIFQVINYVVALLVMSVLFGALYKVLPDVEISWGDVKIGAVATAVLFVLGEILISLYLGFAAVGSTFGAAGSLLVLLVWIYYSAMVLFFGAEFTQVYAARYGSQIVASSGAIALTEETQARQGRPTKASAQRAEKHKLPATAVSYPNWGKAPKQAVAGHAAAGRAATNAQIAHDSLEPLKPTLWAGLNAAMLGLTGLAVQWLSSAIYEGMIGEPPPRKKA